MIIFAILILRFSGEKKAFDAFMARQFAKWHFAPYQNIGWHGMSFIVESLSNDESAN